jgi:hypothetical protein
VRICQTPGEVGAAWRAIVGRVSQLGVRNSEALHQRYETGQQYVVNSVSVPGPDGRPRHWVHEVWEDHRAVVDGGFTVFDRMILLAAQDLAARMAAAYVARVLDAVGLVFGPAHTEIIVTEDRGPVLIEVNARLAGMIDPGVTDLATGPGLNQVALTAEAITDPAGFAGRHHGPYRRTWSMVHVWLAAPGEGVIDPGTLARIMELPTVRSTVGHIGPGAPVTRTFDLGSAPGYFTLVGHQRQVELDAYAIRGYEREGLYR